MALSTTQYGYIIDPMVPFTDGKGNTIKDGFVRVFVAGSSTPVITYRNFDGAANQDLIELDNSGRTKTGVIGSKGITYKVCVYDQLHSQESPILTVDKVSVIGANITAGAGATVVTGLDGLTTKPDGFVDASVVGTDGYVALDHTLVNDDLNTDAKVTAVEDDRYVPLLNEDVNDPDSKMTLGRLWQWVLGKIKSLSTTITAFRTGDFIAVDGPDGPAKIPAEIFKPVESLKIVSNEEYVYAITDFNDTFLFGIKNDGSVEWAKGLPEWLNSRLNEIDGKVDKEDGKSLIDSIFANGVSFVSNEEFLFAFVDAKNSVLFGVKKDGAIYWADGMSSGLSYNLSRIFATLSLLASNKVDKEDGKSLIDSIFANGVSFVSNDEYLVAFIDSENSVLFGVKKDGGFEYGSGIPMPIKQSLYKISHRLEAVEKGIACENLNFSNGYYNVTDTPKQYQVAPASPSSSADYVCAKTSVKKGDLIVLTGRGAISARLWVFVDENRRIIQCSNANWSLYGGSLFAPVDGYLLVSSRKNYYHSASIFRTIRGLDGFVEAYKPHFDFPLSRIYQVEFANASQYIKLLNYIGNNQNVHPKVLYINEGFGGHRYWMGYTPYPGGSSVYENPCVAFSDDGFLWFEINGNPIKDEFSKSGDVVESYGSDTHLVYREDLHRLELWWRKVIDVNPKHELLYRSLSTDGQVWGEPELVFTSSSLADVLSPAVIYQNGQYIMWVVEGTGGAKIKKYIGSVELGVWNWSLDQTINLTFSRDSVDYYPWHLDVSLVNGEYAMCVMCKETDNGPNWDLFVTTSSDAVNWSVPKVLAIGNRDGWDQQMYRSCLLYSPYDGNYRLYYSARTSSNFVYGLGLAMGKNLNKLFGTQT